MVRMKQALNAWRQPMFKEKLQEELGRIDAAELPLQAGLAAGSYALEKPLQYMVIDARETVDGIEAKVGIFYRSLMPGCACAGDPTVEDAQNEYCVVHITIDKQTAEARIERIEE